MLKRKCMLFIITVGTLLFFVSACNEVDNDINNDINNDIASLQAEIGTLQQQIAELQDELEEKESTITELESKLNDKEDGSNGNNVGNEESASLEEQLRGRGDDVVIALENQNFQSFANYVHPEKGVRFSPYAHVLPDEHLRFSAEEVMNFSNDQEEYEWGTQDGSGYPITMTPTQYYEEYIYIREFSREASKIKINEIESRGNLIINIEETYPDAQFVSYYVTAGEEELNWANLILAFEELDGEWYLVGLAVDRWTI
ncbi:FlxA-like family protein [Bacillus alkalicellulosilyticus]|uniref:FlxA-like family protein n=1 Tax=Alkalihalobacterium alkalicellulosilyticum TaxID=1912214 RepID=UPI0009972528|nr:FlxA-like family protein [Bacillus alkalicellulosilyticus]